MYYRYGGRGIQCLWKSFQEFSIDMEKSYKKHFLENKGDTTLERIDNNGNYCKENCTWITKGEQSKNTKRNVIVMYRGKRMILKDFCKYTGKSYTAICSRIRRGMELNKAIM